MKDISKTGSIFLTGFMGVGKSVVAKELASILGWEMRDTDEIATRLGGKSIANIIRHDGEAHFRTLEREAVEQATGFHRAVVSLGGGSLIDEVSMRLVLRAGVLVFLSANVDVIIERLAVDSTTERPLLGGATRQALKMKVKDMLALRLPMYEKANLKVTTDQLTPKEVALKIVERLGLSGT